VRAGISLNGVIAGLVGLMPQIANVAARLTRLSARAQAVGPG
jgi:hypothetical protein